MAADGPADRRQQPVNAEMLQKPALDLDHVADGDGREIASVGFARHGIGAARPGRSPTAAQQVRAHNKVAVGVNRFAGPHRDVPPTGIIFVVMFRHVRVAADRMADEQDVVLRRSQPPIGFVGNGHVGQLPAHLQRKLAIEGDGLRMPQRSRVTDAVATVENIVGHIKKRSTPDYARTFCRARCPVSSRGIAPWPVQTGGAIPERQASRPTRVLAVSCIYFCDVFNAWSRSAMMSRTSSMPTDRRTNSGVTPVWTCSSGVSCECVVVAG